MILTALEPADYLAGDDLVDPTDVGVEELAASLRDQAPDDADLARAAFEWVRDEVAHSLDAEFSLTGTRLAFAVDPGRGELCRSGLPSTIAVVGVVTQRPEAAYALDRKADGDIVVTIHELSDADGLERALAREGVVAEVTYDATSLDPSDLDNGDVRLSPVRIGTLDELMSYGAGCPADNHIGVIVDPADDGGVTFTLAKQFVSSDDTVLHLTTAGQTTDWMAVSVQWENSRC